MLIPKLVLKRPRCLDLIPKSTNNCCYRSRLWSRLTVVCLEMCDTRLLDSAACGDVRGPDLWVGRPPRLPQRFVQWYLMSWYQYTDVGVRSNMSRGDSWSGRVCCGVPHSESCRRACVTATSTSDLNKGCRQSDEIAFFYLPRSSTGIGCTRVFCLNFYYLITEHCHHLDDRFATAHLRFAVQMKFAMMYVYFSIAGKDCCDNARGDDCKDACTDIFRSEQTPTKLQRQKLKEYCEITSPKVTECVKDIVKVTPVNNVHEHIRCCDKSNNIKCRETCKKVLTSKTLLPEIFDGLQMGGCGSLSLQDYFWQCFLKPDAGPVSTSVEVSRIDRVGMDSAKWHCCQRANSSQCGRLCSKTFTKFWATSWDDFHYKCLTQVTEESLRTCIDEVDEPCELGCDGLSFCTHFNNRPTELFRSCTSQADEMARNDVTLWQNQNNITLGLGLTLPLKSISKCSPQRLEGGGVHSHANQICRDICLDILSECVDWTRLSLNYSAESICGSLSPDDPSVSCVRLQNYLKPSTYPRITGQVSSPCKGNPCENDEICLINRNCIHGTNCRPYVCQPGCRLGEVSQYMVPDETFVRIPLPNNPKGCLKICKCKKSKIEECQPLPCVTLTSCLLGNTQQLHGSTFMMDCNQCSCYAGEIICSKRQCESSSLSGRNTAYTTLPCNCPPHYVPVCGRNGITYPSACLAKCGDLNDSDIERYPCQNPCKPNSCPTGQKCVPKTQVCLSLMHKPCPQYECINGSSICAQIPKDPVCDVDNHEYENSCFLAHHNAKLAYRGPCLNRCKFKGQVCGINGKTYISECAAFADMVAVDYEGPCIAVGLITQIKAQQCAGVKCPQLQNPNCLGVTPPGACCPLCGGSVRILYSRKQIDRALYALQNQSTKPLNLRSILKALERQIQLAQCTLRGYVTVELDIFVIVQTTERYPSELQQEACIQEAEKIASLVNMQSPRIVSELSLSSLTAATTVHTQVSASTSNFISNSWYHLLMVLTYLLLS
ncbi:hypothetical protein NQ318_013982 [Aromia moschata]|uniref:Kazal-like domain-containing protein n=1 Tax=Aromia moschata TaxID=1265417 RepID=A0AAV8Z0P7_9CUCU|nr:hypothetical protein NQ318_013982 [Aromia moschata]